MDSPVRRDTEPDRLVHTHKNRFNTNPHLTEYHFCFSKQINFYILHSKVGFN
jgi:hypothetical protein